VVKTVPLITSSSRAVSSLPGESHVAMSPAPMRRASDVPTDVGEGEGLWVGTADGADGAPEQLHKYSAAAKTAASRFFIE
jgi:hypothetical protein